jgi:hypothetical protein
LQERLLLLAYWLLLEAVVEVVTLVAVAVLVGIAHQPQLPLHLEPLIPLRLVLVEVAVDFRPQQ